MALAMSEVDFHKGRDRCDEPDYVFQTAHDYSLALGYYRLISGKPIICAMQSNDTKYDKFVTYSGKRVINIVKYDRRFSPAQTFQKTIHTLPQYAAEFRARLDSIKSKMSIAFNYATTRFCPMTHPKSPKRKEEALVSVNEPTPE